MKRWYLLSLLAVLSLVAVLARQNDQPKPEERSPARACQENLKKLATAMEMFATDNSGRYPSSLSDLGAARLENIPICPAAGKDTYSEGLALGPDAPTNDKGWRDFYYIACHGNHHAREGLSDNLPAMSASAGLLPELPFEGDAQDARTECEKNLKNLATALEMYSVDWHGKYPKSLTPLTPDYLHKIPNCPLTGNDSYSASYQVTNSPGSWSLNCSGSHEGGRPAYDSLNGLSNK